MIQTLILGAEVDVAEWEQGKSLLITHPMGHQFVIPLTGEQEVLVHRKTSGLSIPNGGIAPSAEAG